MGHSKLKERVGQRDELWHWTTDLSRKAGTKQKTIVSCYVTDNIQY